MSDNYQVSRGPEAIQMIVSTRSFASLPQGGQDLEATLLVQAEVDLQTVDPAIIRIGNIEGANSPSQIAIDLGSVISNPEDEVLDPTIARTSDCGETVDLQATDNLQATDTLPLYLPVRAPVLQSSGAVGLQVSALFGGLRPHPNTPILWAAYFQDLNVVLPRVNHLLAGFRTTFHPSANMSDYLVRVISGDLRGGPVVGAGMHLMALYGLSTLNDAEILDRITHLDLCMRYYRSGWVAMRNRRERELAEIEVKAVDLESEKESYQRLKDMYEGESESLARDQARFNYDVDRFLRDKAKFQHDVDRLGHLLDIGVTIEQLQLNHDLALKRLRAILESSVIQNAAQLQLLAHMGLSGGMQQWLARSQELLQNDLDYNISVQANGSQTVNQSPLVSQLNSVTHRLAVTEVQIVEMANMEADSEKLRSQVEYLTDELRACQSKDENQGRHWINNVCPMM